MFRETWVKQVYAVILDRGPNHFIIARGTTQINHDQGELVFGPVRPGSRAAKRWRNPDVTADTYFYRFDIRPVKIDTISPELVRGYCEEELLRALHDAMNQLIADLHAGKRMPRWAGWPSEAFAPLSEAKAAPSETSGVE
ncbi:MAG: hypothetical protein HC927_08735 [Deltaproteobacteria bacterium]|nr:hypothetical protein [Deltaproteobacteria bacterium]